MAYFIVPTALVLLILPLNTHRTEQMDKNFVFLAINETLVAEVISEPDSLPPVDESSDEAMQALNKQLEDMQKLFSEEATITNPYGYPVLAAEDLAPYPALGEAVEDMVRMIALQKQTRSRVKRLAHVSIETWKTLTISVSGNSGAANFQYGNRIFKGHIKATPVLVDVEVKNLRLISKATGGVFLLLGLLAVRGLYKPPSGGIQIGKRSGMIMWDVITIGIGVVFIWGLLDSLLAKYFQTAVQFGDVQMATFMGVFWLVIAIPVIAVFTTATGLQSVLITRQGVSVSGLFGQKALNWSAVEDIHLAEFYSARRVSGIFAPRKLAKVLEVSGGSTTLRIMEPPYASTKKEILDTLSAHAPDELKDSMAELSGPWLSVW